MDSFVKNLNFVERKKADHDKQTNQSKDAVPATRQTDMWEGIRGKLAYEYAKAEIGLRKNQTILGQKFCYEQQRAEMNLIYRNYLELIGCTVYQDSSRRMIYAITNPVNEITNTKVLLNVTGYEVVNCICYYPKICSVLEVRWDGCEQRAICFWDIAKGITPERFLKGLKSKGLLFQVSGRTEKKAASALLAYSLQNAREVELPFRCGWNRMGNGEWHFAGKEEKVMQEVEKHAI